MKTISKILRFVTYCVRVTETPGLLSKPPHPTPTPIPTPHTLTQTYFLLLVKSSRFFRFQYFSLIPFLVFAVVLLLSCNCVQNSLIYRQAKALRKLKLEASRRTAAESLQK